MKGARDRVEAFAVVALCILTVAQAVAVVMLCLDVLRTAFDQAG